MKNYKNWWIVRIFDNNETPKTDHVNKILSILIDSNSIETAISMKLETDALFDEKMQQIRKQRKRELDAINTYFSPFTAKDIRVIDAVFEEPIKR